MAPVIVQIIVSLAARWFTGWRSAAQIGMAALFVVTAGARLTPMRHELAAMIPPPLTGSLWLIDLTGVLEIAGAAALLVPRFRRPAAWALIALLLALFPANAYAAAQGLTLGGAPVTPVLIRAALQAFWIATLWWSSLAAGACPVPART